MGTNEDTLKHMGTYRNKWGHMITGISIPIFAWGITWGDKGLIVGKGRRDWCVIPNII